jgi:hypothetical protein
MALVNLVDGTILKRGAASRYADPVPPHTLHRIALLWSNPGEVWGGTSSTS